MRIIHESGPVRVRECRHGAMAYLPRDEHVGRSLDLLGEWAEAELRLLGLFVKPGSTVVDVGANVGTHALFFAKRVGERGAVIAFEPQRLLHQVLCANMALNGITWARVIRAAVGARPGSVVVPEIDYAAGGNFGGLSLGAWRDGEAVPVVTVDDLDLKSAALMKIDVEGMEGAVLEGAAATVSRLHPVIFVENNRPDGAPEVVRFLADRGYALFWHFSPFYSPDNFAGAAENPFGALVDANMIAVPGALAPAMGALRPVLGPDDTAAAALSRTR